MSEVRNETTTDFRREELGAPQIVDRSTFHADLDPLRIREGSRKRRRCHGGRTPAAPHG